MPLPAFHSEQPGYLYNNRLSAGAPDEANEVEKTMSHNYQTVSIPTGNADLQQQVAVLMEENAQLRQLLERERALEQERYQQVQMFHNLINALPFPVFYKDADEVYRGCNQLFAEQIFGRPVNEVVGKSGFDLLPPEKAAFYHAADQQLLQSGGTQIYEHEQLYTDGRSHTVMFHKSVFQRTDGTPGGIVGAMVDISEHKRVEEELRMRQVALDRASDGVEWIDEQGYFHYVNETTCTRLGYTREELLNSRLSLIDPGLSVERWTMLLTRLKQVGTITMESQHRCKDGSFFPVEVSASHLELDGKNYILAFVRDISERKRAEAERVVLQEQIIAAQQAALRELSTPLIPIADGVVVMPLIGSIDSNRAQLVLDTLLEGVVASRATTTILDITGVLVVDTQVANALLRAARAVRLLGAQVVLTGIRPEVAQTLVGLGADMSGIITRGTLQSGIAYALAAAAAPARRNGLH